MVFDFTCKDNKVSRYTVLCAMMACVSCQMPFLTSIFLWVSVLAATLPCTRSVCHDASLSEGFCHRLKVLYEMHSVFLNMALGTCK